VGIIGLIMAMTYIHESKSDVKPKAFDVKGAVLLGVALSAFVLVLDKGTEWGWASWSSIGCYLAGVIGMIWFVQVEKNHPEPIVDPKFFKNAAFTSALLNNFIIFMGMMGSIFLIPVFSQTFLGYNATQAGYLFIPMAFCIMLTAPFGGRLSDKIQPRTIIAISTFISAIGMYFFIFLDPRSSAWDIIYPLSIMALGMGFGMAPRTNIIASTVEKNEIGVASSILALARNISGAFGIAIFATLLNSSIERNVLTITQNSEFHGDPSQYAQFVGLITLKAQMNGFHTVFLWSSILILIGGFLSFAIPKIKLGEKQETVHVEA
jgi:EmrB/QacA subfamily drug resistance transporter